MVSDPLSQPVPYRIYLAHNPQNKNGPVGGVPNGRSGTRQSIFQFAELQLWGDNPEQVRIVSDERQFHVCFVEYQCDSLCPDCSTW